MHDCWLRAPGHPCHLPGGLLDSLPPGPPLDDEQAACSLAEMTEVDEPRYHEALGALSAAFFEAYAVATGEPPKMVGRDTDEPFEVTVSRRDIRDNIWQTRTPVFQEAGLMAGRIARRTGRELTLMPPTNYVADDGGDLVWRVMFAGQD